MPQWKNISNSWGTEEEWKPVSSNWGQEEPTRYDTSFNPTYEDTTPTIKKYDTGFTPTYNWEPEETWGHWLVGQGLRTLPAIGGSMVGALAGGTTGGVTLPVVGAVPGALAGAVTGGSAGSLIGEGLGQWWDDDYNPQMLGVSAVAGGFPGFYNAKLGGKGLYELGKYAFKGGLEGAAEGILETPFSHQAERRNLFEPSKWEMPSAGEFGTNAAVGFGFGAAAGAGVGKYEQGHNPWTETSGLGRIDPPSPYKNLPTTQDLNFNPHGLPQMRFDTPNREILHDTASDIHTRDQVIQGTVASTDMPTFDVDPFAEVTDRLQGMDIATRIQDNPPSPEIRGQFRGDESGQDLGMGGRDLLGDSPTPSRTFGMEEGGDMATGGGLPPHDDLRARLRQILGREPTQEELHAASANSPETLRNQANDMEFREEIGAGESFIPQSPVDAAVNNVLHRYAQDPALALTEMNKHLAHLSPADQRKAQNLIIQITSKIHSDNRAKLNIPDPLESRPLDPAWEETPEEAMQEDIPVDWLVEGKRQQLRDEGIDPTDMTGWELDMALKEVEDRRSEHLDYVSTQRNVESGEQMPLGLRDRGTGDWLNAQRLALKNQYGPQSEQVRQIDVLNIGVLMEAGMAKEAQEIRALHDMYGRPITPEEEVAALAEHYTKMGDTERAAKYNELADRYSGIQQGQQDMFKPNSFEGGAPDPNDPNQMSQEWIDEQNGRLPPKGPLGVRPSGGPRGAVGMVPQEPESPRQRWAVIRQQQVDEVIRFENQARAFEKQAKAAMDTNNPELAAQHAAAAQKHREMARTANIQFGKDFKGHMKEAERFESMARAREAAGDTEGAARLKAQAETEYLREAGQMELRFRKNRLAQKMDEMGFELSDKTLHAIDDMDPADLNHGLQKDFAELVLSTVDDGPPGLSVEDATPPGIFKKQTNITIRDNNGKPIAHAEMETHPVTGEGSLESWAISPDAGMAQKAILPLAMELEKRGGLVPKGPYSQDTKNFLQRLAAAVRGERGAAPIFTGGGGGGTPPPTPPPTGGSPPGGGGKPKRQPVAGGTWWDRLRDRAGWGQGYKTNKRQRMLAKQQVQWIDEALAMPANMTTTGDLSAPGRQGLMLFHTPEFWNAFIAMFKGIEPKAFDHIDKQLKNMRIMQSQGVDPKTGKPLPSMAEQWGMKMFAPASTPGPHAKGAASNWLETGRFFNTDIPYLTKAWAKSPMAMIIRGSNRAFITFANHLNVNRLQYLADRAQDNSIKAHQGEVRKQGLLGGFNPSEFRFGIGKMMPDVNIGLTDKIDFSTATRAERKAWGNFADSLDPYNNIALGKELADTVNTLTGHAPLKTHLLPFRGAEVNLEGHARLLGRLLFAPGLMASRIRMMNPSTYLMASPTARKQMVGGLFGWAAGYTAGALLLKNGAEAMGYDSEINLDSNSADFGKIRVGNYRMDPSAGMLPYLVLYSRLISGYYTSSSTGRVSELGQGYQATTASTLTDRFISNKQEPIAKFVTDMLSASEHQPVFMKDRMLQMMIPMVAQDIWEVSKEDPGLIPLSVGTFFGHGGQVYQQGVASTRFTNPKNERVYAGGGLRGLIYGADFQNKPQGSIGPRQMGPRKNAPRNIGPRQPTPRQ